MTANVRHDAPTLAATFGEAFGVPPDVEAVVREFRTCEFTTLAGDGTPVTWPTAPFLQSRLKRFLISSPIGLPQKALNVRRDPRVAMLFSDPTASGLTAPPAVLIQGRAEAPDELVTSMEGFEEIARLVFERQPIGMTRLGSLRILRPLLDWYCMRLAIYIYPQRIRWWPRGDFNAAPQERIVVSADASAGARAREASARAASREAWQEVSKHLQDFASAVLTTLDDDGYPVSFRCRPTLLTATDGLRIEVPRGITIRGGPAGLLCHRHDENLWNLRSFGARGRLDRDGEGWSFHPTRFAPGMGIGGPLGMIRLFIAGRRRAGAYLRARGLARPSVPWETIEELKRDVRRSASAR